MSDFRPEEQAKLRRALRFVDDAAPLSPDFDELGAITVRPQRNSGRPVWAVTAVVVATAAVVTPLLLLPGEQTDTLPAPLSAAPAAPDSTTTTAADPIPSVEQIPLDGRPEDIGVTSVDFMGALFPTSPEEHRMTAVWTAALHNVEMSRVEVCMDEAGFASEMPRTLAAEFRRNGDMPDFELDARMGIVADTAADYIQPGPPSSSSVAEADAWRETHLDCSDVVEVERSQRFDQVVGRNTSWWETVRSVNASTEMAKVTEQLLTCVASTGGPEADSVKDLYSDNLTMDAESVEAAVTSGLDLAGIIAACSGGYNDVREELLDAERDLLLARVGNSLADAESYFTEVIEAAGIATLP